MTRLLLPLLFSLTACGQSPQPTAPTTDIRLVADRPHTSNAPVYLRATGYRGAAHCHNEPAVTNSNLITAGVTAPLEFAYPTFQQAGSLSRGRARSLV